MRKAGIVAIGVILFCLIIIIGVVSASEDPWKVFSRKKGELGEKEGVIYNKPDNQQKREVLNSIDPRTNKSNRQIFNSVPDLMKKEIRMNQDENDIVLTFEYVKKNGKTIVLPIPDHKPGASYQLFPYPGSEMELIEFEGSIYILELEKGNIRKILHDSTGPFSLQQAKQKAKKENSFIWWGARPSVNPSGTRMVFYTNRSGEDEIWVKNLETKEESFFMKSALTVEGWINNGEFIADSFSKIIKVNIETGEFTSFGKASSVGILSPYLIFQKDTGSLIFKNVNSGDEKIYTHKQLGFVVNISPSDETPMVVLINQYDKTQPFYNLLVIDVRHFSTTVIDIPNGKIPNVVRWVDKNTFLLTMHDQITYDVESVFVDTDKL